MYAWLEWPASIINPILTCRHGWNGLLVEPLYYQYQELRSLNRRAWSGKERKPVFCFLETFVGSCSIHALLAGHFFCNCG
jgi:hypothetical protein